MKAENNSHKDELHDIIALKDLDRTGGFTLYATSTNSAVRELGFTSIQDAVLGGTPSGLRVIGTKDVPRLVGRLTGDTTFEIIIGGTHYPITIEAGETVIVKDGEEIDGNRTIIDLINDLNKAIKTPSLVSSAVGVKQLTSDAHFSISINGGAAVPVTVEAALTNGSVLAYEAFDGSSDFNIAEDTITFGSPHKFITGDEVVYTDGGGTTIGGLTDGGTYYVIVEDSTTVKKLAESEDDANSDLAIILLAMGAGADHRLTHTANDDFGDLINDINRAITATSLSDSIKAEHYKWTNPSTLVVGSEEAPRRANLRPPLKLDVQFSRIQLSQRHACCASQEKESVQQDSQDPSCYRAAFQATFSTRMSAIA